MDNEPAPFALILRDDGLQEWEQHDQMHLTDALSALVQWGFITTNRQGHYENLRRP